MNSNNPAFRDVDKVIRGQRGGSAQSPPEAGAEYLQQLYNRPAYTPPVPGARYLTLDDVVAKTAMVLVVTVLTGALTMWTGAHRLAIPALLATVVLGLVIIAKQSTSPGLILGYAAVEGVLLGAVSLVFESLYSGIVLQAIVATLGVFVGMLVVYKTGAIRVTPKFTRMLLGVLIGVVVLMAFNLVAGLFGADIHLRDGSSIAIVFSVVCIVVAALSFMLDFDAIDKAIKAGVPARSAWYFAFGLMVTLVWLYLEILRLLSYLRPE